MSKIYEAQMVLVDLLASAEREVLGEEVKLKDLVSYGFNGIYENGKFIGYSEEDFTEDQLESFVRVSSEYFKDENDFYCVSVEFTLKKWNELNEEEKVERLSLAMNKADQDSKSQEFYECLNDYEDYGYTERLERARKLLLENARKRGGIGYSYSRQEEVIKLLA